MKKVIIVLMGFTLLFNSCKDPEEVIEESLDSTTTQDNARLEQEWNALDETVKAIVAVEIEASIPKSEKGEKKVTGCYSVVSSDFQSSPMELTVKFDGSSCSDGRVRSGTLSITFTGAYVDEGTVITTNTSDYVVDGYQVSGTKTVTNVGAQVDNSIKYKVEVENGSVTDENGENRAAWVSSLRYRIWTAGYDTPSDITDDSYAIYGEATGLNRKGEVFTYTIPSTNPLTLKYSCWVLTRLADSGIMTISPAGKADRVVDYGDGTCDRKVKLTIGSTTVNLSL